MSVKDYKELEVYRLAFDAAMEIFEISKTFFQEEKYSLTDQIRRSSRSVCANIAEAWRKRRYEAAFVSKLSDADTEAAETEVWLDFSLKCGYIQEAVHKKLKDKYDHICRQLYTMMKDAPSWCRSFSSLNAPRSTLHAPRAFTLVELMVVVAIISILLMLLIPNIRTMREKAWSSYCQNNLRQYGVAMNQYMADNSGYFIYPGAGGQGAGSGYGKDDTGWEGTYGSRVTQSGGQAGSVRKYWVNMIPDYIPAEVTIQSLSAGNPSVRVCPVVLQQIKAEGNFFDPDSPNFKGLQDSTDWGGNEVVLADFEQLGTRGLPGYDANGKLILDPAFTTYAINPIKLYQASSNCPANVIAFIDWNARDGWWATLSYTNWMFNGTNSLGVAVKQTDPPKRNDGAWWLTEVGFHHLQGKVYGANYVAMDGHVGWVGSNTISITNFTGP